MPSATKIRRGTHLLKGGQVHDTYPLCSQNYPLQVCTQGYKHTQRSRRCSYRSGCTLHYWFDIHPHLQNICMCIQLHLYPQSVAFNRTIAVQFICCQHVSCATGTFERTISVRACLVAATIASKTLIYICMCGIALRRVLRINAYRHNPNRQLPVCTQ